MSASEEEHAAASERARDLRDHLSGRGWSGLGLGDSGNGGHVLVPVEIPNDQASEELLKGCLAALAGRFNDDRVTVDPTTFNAARVWKLYGTLAAKGDSVEKLGRVHRLARLIEPPHWKPPIDVEQLRELAAEVPPTATIVSLPSKKVTTAPNGKAAAGAPRGDYATLDVVSWFGARGHYGRKACGAVSVGRGAYAAAEAGRQRHDGLGG
jgi:hypothetical protein